MSDSKPDVTGQFEDPDAPTRALMETLDVKMQAIVVEARASSVVVASVALPLAAEAAIQAGADEEKFVKWARAAYRHRVTRNANPMPQA